MAVVILLRALRVPGCEEGSDGRRFIGKQLSQCLGLF
jgi:hypothetical protein